MDDLLQRLKDLISSLDGEKEGEKELHVVEEPAANVEAVVAVETEAPQSLIPQSKDAVTFYDAEAKDDDDVFIAPIDDEDLPITSTANAGDEEREEDDDEEDEDLPLPDAGQDLGDDDDDEDDDHDEFTIQ
ncbi:uncharacterized protein LOC112524965 [Cynara cardunculus var. scolymus]|uniref:uncharacterized protein LOC112524965 n=1 Tax=Cynara cardunculus var. scolymus TaxID=59895 RepID=UPI000D62728C|nr:uncharacterized protein LOC112524965 [Cynara cardunculus var. scolymus]